MNRRDFLRVGALGTAAMGVGVGVDSWLVEPHHVELVRQTMPLEQLPPELIGRTLLQVSDIHVGPRVDSGYLIRSFELAHGLAPDFVAVTGDFVSSGSAVEHAELARVLRHLPRGRLGTVASLGNHDYGRGWRQMEVADLVTRVARDAGIVVLRNEVRTIGGLQLAGLGDFWSPEFGGASGTIDAIRPGQPTVILSHNPDVQDEPLWTGVRGWVLAGHTHGGQVKPPFLPPPILPVRNKRYTAGVFDVGPGRTLYINRGIGHLTQVRFNCPPELTLFTLAAEPLQGSKAGSSQG